MEIKRVETVTYTDDNGHVFELGSTLQIVYNASKPDSVGEFAGIGKKDTLLLACEERTYPIGRSSIKKVICID